MFPNPPVNIDWASITAWSVGIATVIASVVIAAWRAISKAMSVASTLPAPVQRTDTRIVTTDSVAMNVLAGSIEALNQTVTEIAQILRREIADQQLERQQEDRRVRDEEQRRIGRKEALEELKRQNPRDQDDARDARRPPRKPGP